MLVVAAAVEGLRSVGATAGLLAGAFPSDTVPLQATVGAGACSRCGPLPAWPGVTGREAEP
ncbi:hypothetical protein TPA0905_32360 [Streptomyces olivaceus]|nr:hypothetical protein TPA0905_32360 [Streptomyces olivaceus]